MGNECNGAYDEIDRLASIVAQIATAVTDSNTIVNDKINELKDRQDMLDTKFMTHHDIGFIFVIFGLFLLIFNAFKLRN